MKYPYKLLFAFFLLPLFSNAQSNYKPGYVVTLKGDTLHGFIDYREWGSNPNSINFKKAFSDGNRQTLTVSSIRSFNVNDMDAYQKYVGPISMDVTDISHLNTGRSTRSRIDSVFLKLLQRGNNVALYSYTDNSKTRFYIGEAPGYAPTELVYKIYDDPGAVTNIHGSTVSENTYQKQLFSLANKYNVLDDNLTSTLEASGYSEPDLLAIVSKINKISKSDYEKKYPQNARLNLFVSAALNISNTYSSKFSDYSTGGGKSATSYLPAISFGINLLPNPASKVQLRAGLSFEETQFKSIYELQYPNINVKASFDQIGISVLPQVIYNFYNTEDLKFYLGAGFELTYFAYGNSYFGNSNPGISNADFAGNPYSFETFNNYFLLSTGVQFNKKLELFINYSSNSTTRGDYFEFSDTREQIGVNYFFK